MSSMYYIGLDVHKKTISYCVKDASRVRSTRKARSEQRDGSWTAGCRLFLSLGAWRWKRLSSRAESMIICCRTLHK